MKRAALLVAAALTACTAAPPPPPALAPRALNPMSGMWSYFGENAAKGLTWIGKSERAQSFNQDALSDLQAGVAQILTVDKSQLSPAKVSGCLDNNTVVEFRQRAGGRDITNAGAVLTYGKDNHLSYCRFTVAAAPADLNPPPLPADRRGFVMKAIEGRISTDNATEIKIDLSDPFLYADKGRALWVTRASLVITRPDSSLPDDLETIIELAGGKALTIADHHYPQVDYKANVLLSTPGTKCTHEDYLASSTSPPYVDESLLRLAPNAVTATGDYATFVTLDEKNPHPPWTCTDNSHQCDFHFTWNGMSRQFSEVLTYYHVTAVQLYVQDLGFKDLATGTIQADVLTSLGGILAEYRSSTTGPGELWFSIDKNNHSVARDPKVIVHEYGHALETAAVGNRFEKEGDPQGISEGFSDYLALSTFAQNESPQCRECFAAFMNNGNCYRQLDNPMLSVPPYNRKDPTKNPTERHDRGLIWAKALWQTLDSVRAKVASQTWDDARKKVDRGALMGLCYIGHASSDTIDMPNAALATLAAVNDDSETSPYFDDFCSGFTQQNILTAAECAKVKNPAIPIH